MTEPARREYAAVMRARYQHANRRERGRLLDEYCRTTGCHRKAAIRRLRTPPHPAGRSPGRPCRHAFLRLVTFFRGRARAGSPAGLLLKLLDLLRRLLRLAGLL